MSYYKPALIDHLIDHCSINIYYANSLSSIYHHLGDACSGLMGLSLVTPVASSQRVLESVSYSPGLDSQLNVEVL